eukprot:2860375-Prymnesium_polylepis.1
MESWSWELLRPHLRAEATPVEGRGGRRGGLAIAGDMGGHRRAGARLGHHSAVPGRCLELGPLPALN